MMASLTDSMRERTGRSVEEWVALVHEVGPDPLDQRAVRAWLRDAHGVPQNSQWAIADAAATAAGWERPDVDGYTDAIYSGRKAHLRPIHDAIMTLGLYVYTRMEFDITAIAALLTIIGFSLNDTVVIYDRMRENLRRFKKMPLEELIDLSLNSTLSRTILTAGTTFIAVMGLVLFGGDVIRSFTISMLFGVIVGTFSSIYVAAPMLIYFKLRPDAFDKDEDKAKAADASAAKPAT